LASDTTIDLLATHQISVETPVIQEGPKVVSEQAWTELAWDAQRHTCFRRGSAGGCYHKRL